MIPVTTFRGKAVAVFGLGGSGIATCRALIAGGAAVAGWDDGEAARAKAATDGIAIVDLATADWSQFAALVLAPGAPLTHPEPHWTVNKARAAGVEIIGDIELFFRERGVVCPEASVIAITGTNGKSTTTALVAHILRSAGRDAQMGGNIGVPILALAPFSKDRTYVIEMSSFQIDLTTDEHLHPTIGMLLNVTPDHLDRHGPADDPELALRNYAAIKERLVARSMTALVSADDEHCRRIGDRRSTVQPGAIERFSVTNSPAEWTGSGTLLATRTRRHTGSDVTPKLADLRDIGTLRGQHNLQNALAAFAACELSGLSASTIAATLQTFPGLPHRMEEIGRVGKVAFVNDSKATNADSTEKALASWASDIYWIVGGTPKEGGIAPLAPYFPRIAKAYLIGASSDAFAVALEGRAGFERCGTLEIAIARAAAEAAGNSGAQPVVLLSPACASYDQFKSFEHRGNAFRDIVARLPGVAVKPRSA